MQFPTDLLAFIKEIRNGELLFLFSDSSVEEKSKWINFQQDQLLLQPKY